MKYTKNRSKSPHFMVAAAKSGNFVDTLWPQKLMGTKFLEFDFFYLERQGYRYYHEKSQVGLASSSCINLTMKL